MIRRAGRAHRTTRRCSVQRLRALMSSWEHDRSTPPASWPWRSRVSGVLWLSGAVTLLLTLALPGSDDRRAVGRRRDRRVRGGLGRADALQGPVGALAGTPFARLHRPEPRHRRRAHARHRRHRLAGARLPVVRRRLRGLLLPAAPGAGLLAGLRRRPRAARCSTTATPSRATSRASSSSSCPSTASSAASSSPGASCWPAPPRRARRARGPPAPDDRRAVLAAARRDRGRRRLAAGRRSSRSCRSTPGTCWAPTAPPSSATRSAERVTVLGRWTHDEHGHRRPGRHHRGAPGQPARPPALRRGHRARPDGRRAPLRAPRRPGAPRRRACGARSSSSPRTPTSSPPGPRSACRTTPTSSPPRWPTPRTARGWTPRRRSTRSPACPTTAPSASA